MILKSNGSLGMALAAIALIASSVPAAAGQRHAARRGVTLNSGTVIPVKLDSRLNSKDAHEGDAFTATVTDVDSYTSPNELPRGTKMDGVVKAARALEGKNPGMLDLAFTRITLPTGRSYDISGSPISLDNKSIVRSNGRIVAKPGNKGPNRLQYVGIGAGAGLLVNILGHRKGTLTDVLIGAGLGYGAGSLIKSGKSARDVDLKAGTSMGVALNRNLALGR